jgi:hypothetical protein
MTPERAGEGRYALNCTQHRGVIDGVRSALQSGARRYPQALRGGDLKPDIWHRASGLAHLQRRPQVSLCDEGNLVLILALMVAAFKA